MQVHMRVHSCTPWGAHAAMFDSSFHTPISSQMDLVVPPFVRATQKSQINTVPTPTVAWTTP